MRGLVHLEEYLENLEIPVDVDKKKRAYNIVPVWWGKLCGKPTVFIIIYSIERKREPRSCGGEKRRGGRALGNVFLEKKEKKGA